MVQLQLRHRVSYWDPLPQSACGAGCSSGRGPDGVFWRVCGCLSWIFKAFVAGTRTRVPVGERTREGRPLAVVNSPQASRVPKPARRRSLTRQPSKPTPTTLPNSGDARASDPPTPHRTCFPEPHTPCRKLGGVPRRKAWRSHPAQLPGTPKIARP